MERRLSKNAEIDAISDFADYRYPDGAPEGFLEGCEVIYRDDEDGAAYQIVDGEGHGDGSGIWTKIESVWCACGRESDADAFDLCQGGFETEAAAVAWLKSNYRDCSGYREFYIDREDNENPADLWAKILPSGDLRFELASGMEATV